MLYKSKILTLVTIGYSCCIMRNVVIGPKWPFYSCCNYFGLFGTGFMQVMYLGRAPRTKETLPDCLKWRGVTRHPLVFRELTGSQWTPEFEASHFACLPTLSRTFIIGYICLTKNKIWVFHPGGDLRYLASPKHTKFIFIILCTRESQFWTLSQFPSSLHIHQEW